MSWYEHAACRGLPPKVFYPPTGNPKDIDPAKALCATCPVILPCRRAGRDEPAGIWGGITEGERGWRQGTARRGKSRRGKKAS